MDDMITIFGMFYSFIDFHNYVKKRYRIKLMALGFLGRQD